MKLDHLSLEQLTLSPLNVRKKGGKDIADLLPLIRRQGIVQPLIVREHGEGFEIVAGQRRYNCALALKQEGIDDPVPVVILEDGDDATAIEISLTENISHLPMDDIDQYKAFAAMKAQGVDVPEIAARFGVTDRLVTQRLAIAGIIDPILNAYRREEINAATLRTLTMASAKQQREWWKLCKSENGHAPTGWHLKQWLFGGTQIPVSNALFDVESYPGAIVADLFGEERYFADPDAFWTMQNAAIAERRDAYKAKGWGEVVILDTGERFAEWTHVKTPKSKGGKVFIAVTNDGEVAFHEGWLSEKEAKHKAKAEAADSGESGAAKAERGELTKAMQNYLGLHRYAAVRTELLAQPKIALRLAVAHMIAGSGLWDVRADEQRADNDAISASLAASMAEAGFAEEHARIRAMLGIEDEGRTPVVSRRSGFGRTRDLAGVFETLMQLDDKAVMRVLAFVMAETLAAHTHIVDMLGERFTTDMRNWWTPDQAFFDLLRDKEAINEIVREVAGDITANAHVTSTAKVQKKIVGDCLTGEGREKVEGWLPRYMAFPASGYTGRFAPLVKPEPVFTDEPGEWDDEDGDDLAQAA